MNTTTVEVGKTYYFEWRNTPNTVIATTGAAHPNGDVSVTLRGPRGGGDAAPSSSLRPASARNSDTEGPGDA